MKKVMATILTLAIAAATLIIPVEVKATTPEQFITTQMLLTTSPFKEAYANVTKKMNRVEQLKKRGASTQKILQAQAEVDAACDVYNNLVTEAFSPLTYYGVYPMSTPDYDTLAYTNVHDYKLSVLHETNLIRKRFQERDSAQEIATNTLQLMNDCKAELDAMIIKASENPTLLPQVDELRAIYNAYQNEYINEQNLANQAAINFDMAVDTFPSATERKAENENVSAYAYKVP